MVGASGAISAVLGAYLALYPHARIKTLALVFIVHIPAWIYLGGWFLFQLLEARDSIVDPAAGGERSRALRAHRRVRVRLDRRPRLPRQRAETNRGCAAAVATDALLAMKLPPVTPNLERGAAWSWRLLVCASVVALVGRCSGTSA